VRRGDFRDKPNVIFIAIFVLVILGVFSTNAFGATNFVVDLFDLRSGEAPLGASMLGVNLETGDLMYYNGEKWKEIKTDDVKKPTFVLSGYQFDSAKALEEFREFYLSERRPKELYLSVSHWRYWHVLSPPSLEYGPTIIDTLKNRFVGFENIYVGLQSDGKLIESAGNQSPTWGFSSDFLTALYSKSIPSVISWRDQILEGKECEKFLTLTLTKDNNANPLSFTVRKVDQYIFVDVTKPVLMGTTEKWQDTGCFKIESYDDSKIDRSKWRNDAWIEISFDEAGSDTNDGRIVYRSTGWFALRNGREFSLADGSIDEDYKIASDKQRSLKSGLDFLFGKETGFTDGSDDTKISVKVIESDKAHIVSIPLTSDGEVDLNRNTETVYLILDEYNKYLKEISTVSCSNLQDSKSAAYISVTIPISYTATAADPSAHGISPFVVSLDSGALLEVIPVVRQNNYLAVVSSQGSFYNQVVNGAYLNPTLIGSKVTPRVDKAVEEFKQKQEFKTYSKNCVDYCAKFISNMDIKSCASNFVVNSLGYSNKFEDIGCVFWKAPANGYNCELRVNLEMVCNCKNSGDTSQ
jgi:hypothetical protein